MPSNSYDLVVLGDDLAALVCATVCARRGMRTLVVGEGRPARYALGPFKLPVEPVLWPTQPGSAGERVVRELNAELALKRRLREHKLPAQLVTPDLRIDLGGDRLASELTREAGDAAGAAWLARWERAGEIARALDPVLGANHALPGAGFFERREVARLVERAAREGATWWAEAQTDPHAALWARLAAVALRHPGAAPPVMARVLEHWRAGPLALRGDGDAIRELLVERLTTAGGELRIGRATELAASWGKVASVTLASGDELGAGQVVTSQTPAEVAGLLGRKAPKRLGQLAGGMTIVGYRYTLNLVVDQAGVPEHMAPTVAVVADPTRPPVGDAAFSVHLGEPDELGRVSVTLAAVVPSDGPAEPERLSAAAAALRAALRDRLEDVMPFLERHLVLAHSPFEATPPQVPGGRGSYDVPRTLPLAMTPVWCARVTEATAEQLTGSTLRYGTGLKNLTLTGEQVLPALGLEGALAAGWSAAKVACAIAGKKKDYLRDEVVRAAG